MRSIVLGIALLFLAPSLFGQSFAGINLGPLYGRTLDAQLYIYPKNEDWIAVSLSGGYTFSGRGYFIRQEKDCLENLRNGGWHLRLGFRNDLTTDNLDNHLYWEALAVYTRHTESATINTCAESSGHRIPFNSTVNMLGGAVRLGYQWNPLRRKTIYQRFVLDFGLQIGAPIIASAPLVAERNHYSGLGITYLPIRSVALEPIIAVRWKLNQRRYGFFKGRERKRFKDRW